MSEEELEFHYFKMHDYDNNNKLDGVEIGKALTHFHDGKKNNLLPCLWCLMTTALSVVLDDHCCVCEQWHWWL